MMANNDRPCTIMDRLVSNFRRLPLSTFCAVTVDQVGSTNSGQFQLEASGIKGNASSLEECVSIPLNPMDVADLKPGQTLKRNFTCTPADAPDQAKTFTAERSCSKDAAPDTCERVKSKATPLKPK